MQSYYLSNLLGVQQSQNTENIALENARNLTRKTEQICDEQMTIKQPTTDANHKFCPLFHVTLAVYHIAPEAEMCTNMLNNSVQFNQIK